MEPEITPLDKIHTGRVNWIIKVRVMNIWKVPDFNNPLQTGTMELLLLDAKLARIQATVKGSLIPATEKLVEEGGSYHIRCFSVSKNDHNLRATSHMYRLIFVASTKCEQAEANDIPTHHFNFENFSHISYDVIGHVVEVDKMKEVFIKGKKKKLKEIVLQDLESNKLTCTLWEDFAEKMHKYLLKHDKGVPVIVIMHLCTLRTFNGETGISNAYNGTKLFINHKLKEDSDYRDRLGCGNLTLTQAVTQLSRSSALSLTDDFLQTPRKSISDLYEAIEMCFHVVLAKPIEIVTDWGWNYQSCDKCKKKVEVKDKQFNCKKCGDNVLATLRYKLEIEVLDDTGSATFMLFDNVMTDYFGKSASKMLSSVDKGNVTANYPKQFNYILEKEMLFKVEIKEGNIEQKWQSYTVKRMTDDKDLIEEFKKQQSVEVSNEDDNANLRTTNSTKMDDNMKVRTKEGKSTVSDNLSQLETIVLEDGMGQSLTSKAAGKRCADNIECYEKPDGHIGQSSSFKIRKLLKVKKEPFN